MDTFQEYHADIRDPARVTAQLRERGLVTFSGIADRTMLAAVARRVMTIRPHRDAGTDGVTVITDTQADEAGYAAFTDAELVPHTDGSSVPDPPGLLLLACQQPAEEGGKTLVADGARVTGTLADRHPAALRALSAPSAAFFGAHGGYLGPVFAPADPGRASIRLRLDDLAWFSADVTAAIPMLRAAIEQQLQTFRLRVGEGLLLNNTRWLHGRDRYIGRRVMLRILGDPLPGTGIMLGFPSPAAMPGARPARAA
jgi:alpha-ketoglutarate-dependent taurine dioxygenase